MVVGFLILSGVGAVGTHTVKNQSFKNLQTETDEIVDIEEYVSGEVIVGFYTELRGLDPIDVGYIDSFEGHNIKEKIEVLNVAVLEVNEGEERGFIDRIIDSPLVEYAELNWIVHAVYTPNDPQWGAQWGPQRIHCEEAWDTQQGSSSVKIAILDTGVDYNHEDIAGNYVSGGYDWINNDNDPMDDNDHGTHCAGIAAAVMDNNKGIAGVAQVSIMAEKVLDSGGSGSSSQVANGITHAADNGADVISMSLSSTSPSSTIKNACIYAYNTKGVVIVAAAGNDGNFGMNYPAGFNTVIAVGATDNTDHRCSFSNYGDGLELVAPGKRILSTIIGDDYDYLTGTSMATPHVAGVAALAISEYPNKDNVWIRQKLVDTAEDLGPAGWDEDFGYGLVDASLGGGGPGQWPKVNIKIYKVKEVDDLDWPPWPHNNPEWYYRVSVDSQSIFEYNGYEQEVIPGWWWIFIWNSQSTWTPDKTYSFDAKNPTVTVKIKLMEYDGILEFGQDDLADVSAYSGGGVDNSIDDVRGAIYTGTYNIITNELTGDTVGQDGSYFTTNGEDDGSTGSDENDAKVWFKITDTYYKPDLDCDGSLSWTDVKPGETVTGSFKVKNIGESGSKLDWEVKTWPSWGTWTFTPSSGTGLTPAMGWINVDVEVIGPDEQNEEFTGEVKVINSDDSSDFCIIPVSLSTPTSNQQSENSQMLLPQFLQRILRTFHSSAIFKNL